MYLAEGHVDEAAAQAQKAEGLFTKAAFFEGIAHVNLVWGMIWRTQGHYDEAERALRSALAYFVDTDGGRAEAARTKLEEARTLRARPAPRPMVKAALLEALDRAERCRRDTLVGDIEAELKKVDETEHCLHVYRRARGRDVREDTVSLLKGIREDATVIFLDLQGSTDYARNQDPEVVMITLNQMMADLAGVLERHSASVTAYLGDGFMALLRGTNHAKRAVAAALDLDAAMGAFNRPREVLMLPLLRVRIGIGTGEVFIGNVGTYQKMDFTAIGTTVNLAARLQPEAEPGLPCISHTTYEHVQESFIFKEGNPRTVPLKGLGERQVWDVVGRR